jgi:hypothetical protein
MLKGLEELKGGGSSGELALAFRAIPHGFQGGVA